MANSMTGFGRADAERAGYRFSVELKAVNHRFLEIVVRSPRHLLVFEERIRKALQGKFQRGRIEVHVNMAETEEKKRLVKVDKDLALSYDKTLMELASELQVTYRTDVYRLAGMPEVLSVEEPELEPDFLWEICAEALDTAAENFNQMRRQEGEKLKEDLAERLDSLEKCLQLIAERAPGVVADHQKRLQERLQMLLGEVELDEARLANEVAYFADRASIAEELVRFDSHLAQGRDTLQSSEAVGRKLDFLVQEMNREINTIGAKANDLQIGQQVINVKSELEKIREQIQNLE